MIDWSTCPAVEQTPGKVSGAWVFTNTRVPLSHLFANLEAGATIEEFLDWFEGVEDWQVRAVLKHLESSLIEDLRCQGALPGVDEEHGAAGAAVGAWKPADGGEATEGVWARQQAPQCPVRRPGRQYPPPYRSGPDSIQAKPGLVQGVLSWANPGKRSMK